MNNSITDVIIHTNDCLDPSQYASLSDTIYRQPGIVSLSRNVHTPRFLMVVYNAAVTRSREILDCVKAQGFESTLIGI